ncbi:MAG: DUF5106 domain-containing protein [Muribaculaceae bacterium]|nr:DUF5106 domain-containing protein [Muribaculaceae bacterium]
MRFRFIILSLLIIIAAACNDSKRTRSAGPNGSLAAVDNAQNLPLPDIPDSLTTDEEKAAYVVTHFWDGMDFMDRSLSLDTAFMEQNFSNFVSMIPIVTEKTAEDAVKSLVAKASADKEAFNLLIGTADLYLDHPDSPMRNEETYILFLRNFLDAEVMEDYMRDRYEYRLTQAMKNRPGSEAPNFKIVTRDGKVSDMRSLLGAGENILMFYDSDCEHCKEISQRLAGMRFEGDVRVVAIDVAGDRQLWEDRKGDLPDEWTVAYDLDNIEERELFYLPALPTFYILNSSGVILAKDAPL